MPWPLEASERFRVPGIEVRDLTPDDIPQLIWFQCSLPGEPWLDEVQNGIRQGLTWTLANDVPGFQSIGLFNDGELLAVGSWELYRPEASTWWVSMVAVQAAHRRQHHGVQLKGEILRRAEAAGITKVVSEVAPENEAMLALNRLLGARFQQRPQRPNYVYCVITV